MDKNVIGVSFQETQLDINLDSRKRGALTITDHWSICDEESPIHRKTVFGTQIKIATLLGNVLVYLLSESMLKSWSAIDFDYFDYFSQ